MENCGGDSSGSAVTSRAVSVERFDALYQQLYNDLWQYCQRRSATADQANEVLSETMLVLWRRLDEIPDGDDARPWLFGVARNHLRKRYEDRSRSEQLIERLKSEYSTRRQTVDPAEHRDAIEVLDALGQLSDPDREVLELSAWEGLTHKQISTVLDISENAVAVRLHRARERFDRIRQSANQSEDSPKSQLEDQSDNEEQTR